MEELPQKAFEYFGALAFCGIGLVGALGYVTRKWVLALARIEALHELRLADALKQSEVGEAMRIAMTANTSALLANTDIMKMAVTNRSGPS